MMDPVFSFNATLASTSLVSVSEREHRCSIGVRFLTSATILTILSSVPHSHTLKCTYPPCPRDTQSFVAWTGYYSHPAADPLPLPFVGKGKYTSHPPTVPSTPRQGLPIPTLPPGLGSSSSCQRVFDEANPLQNVPPTLC